MSRTATGSSAPDPGPYLGYAPIGAPLPVRFDATRAPRENRAYTVLFVGTLGSGETVTSQAIEIRRGAPRLPRNGYRPQEPRPRPRRLPELERPPTGLELLGPEAQQGALDPLAIGLPDISEELGVQLCFA